ncbi:hypothetical protein DCCM_3645 [Desulfocucumis palustris]|uniref:Uncharacterized protein n=1 Tax=Desulfocucumis palustris TaxID=1898651 RepID=A0A2L2XJS4_9FIRM|nr:hypothetical protein [Desulfocucumis palustris]GBF34526.1 hypothetical protein DCCM_3645 [Desulfocucumis palustris]
MTFQYQYGDVILAHGDNIFSEAIQNFTGSFYSHAAMCVNNGKVIEMLHDGFNYNNNGYINGARAFMVIRHRRLYYSPYPEIQRLIIKMRNYVEFLRKNPPKYDYFEIIRQAVELLKSKGNVFFRNGEDFSVSELMETGRRLICSALIDSVYEKTGIDLFPGREPYSITPADIAELAYGPNSVFIVIQRYMPR